MTLFDNATVSSSAAGAISASFNNNPSAAANFTELSTSWMEYRVLGMRLKYNPNNIVNTATLLGFNGYHSIIHGAVVSPTTLAQASSTGISKPWNAFTRFTREWRMSEIDEAAFLQTSAPSSTSDVLVLFAQNGSISQYYGNIEIEYLVQARSHRM